ncbi:MAG: fasciclin domain-containing protein [Cyclobacteriaceae bacterium]|nr:fasciclin domain-containing protein [Cyclobacteriaceae bacterium]MCH8515440.1 fasciclin domain-containing protein [Cyclobacteriaceae bacterium]
MKTKNNSLNFLQRFSMLLAFAFAVSFTACSDDDDVPPVDNGGDEATQSIVEIASETEDLSILVAALGQANLVDAVSGDGPFTVFAPTNSAFEALLASSDDWNALGDIPDEVLSAVLQYHVVGALALSTDLSDGQEVSTLQGETITVSVSGGNVTLNGSSSVVTADVRATNGVVHIIDEVLLPPSLSPSTTVIDAAGEREDLSILRAALEALSLDVLLSNPENSYTALFAPNNAAFEALFEVVGVSGLDELVSTLGEDAVAAVLTYHAVAGAPTLSSEFDANPFTLESQKPAGINTLWVNPAIDGITVNGIDVIEADIDGGNGIIHIVESVLLPPDVTPLTIADLAGANGLTSLVAALDAAGIAGMFADANAGPWTVFAPTNEAFEKLVEFLDERYTEDITLEGVLGLGEGLVPVLQYHLVGDNALVYSAGVSDGDVDTALDDAAFTVSGFTLIDDEEREANILRTDLVANNGVVHVIDEVILPTAAVTTLDGLFTVAD